MVIANGLAAPDLIADVPLEAKKGHLLITDRYPGTIHHQVLELGYIKSAHHARGTSVAFNAQPRPTGQVLIGSSRQFGTLDPAVEIDVLAAMLARATRYLPGIGALNAIRAWTGFRAATPDGLPLIGPARFPGDRLWLAAGHEGLGVTTSLGTAKLIAAQMLGEPVPFDIPTRMPSRRNVSHGSTPMAERVRVIIDGEPLGVPAFTTVAAAIAMRGVVRHAALRHRRAARRAMRNGRVPRMPRERSMAARTCSAVRRCVATASRSRRCDERRTCRYRWSSARVRRV